MNTPLIIAHRGRTGSTPENTVTAALASAAAGADIVELDIRLTLDRRPVVIHDPFLGRVTDRRGPVSLWPSFALRFAHTHHERVPLLRDVLRALPETTRPGLHVKALGALQPTLRTISRYGDPTRTWLWLESMNAVLEARHRLPDIHCVLLRPAAWTTTRREQYFRDAQVAGASAVSVASGAVDHDLLRLAHRHRLLVFTRIDEPAQVIDLARIGVDGVITPDTETTILLARDLGKSAKPE